MLFIQRIPAERLLGFNLQKGDTLQVVAVEDSDFVVQVSRVEPSVAARGKASEWLESARGSVKLAAGETVEDVQWATMAPNTGSLPDSSCVSFSIPTSCWMCC